MKAPTVFVGVAALLLAGAPAVAHPMGNLSVNHYAKLTPSASGINIIFALDLAEIPTFELRQGWDVPGDAPRELLRKRAAEQARVWVAALEVSESGRQLVPEVVGTDLVVLEGAGNLPVFRVTTRLRVAGKGGRVVFQDHNYPTRAGWREIVIEAGTGAAIAESSKGAVDLSEGLAAYPQDPTLAPPQDSSAWFEWKIQPRMLTEVAQPTLETAEVPASGARVDTPSRAPEATAAGTVRRGDAISSLLRAEHMSPAVIVLLLGLAFWFGALHALEPGHGKTMVAAYLVGTRGTKKHALLLGGMVTFTHTVSVFALGLATMFLSQYIMPEKISKVLGIVSGVSIVWIGGLLLWRRARGLSHGHAHQHHQHGHPHPHQHDHGHASGPAHTHLPEGEITLGSLMALGATGGLVPCPSALILLLSAISIGRVGLGLVLLTAFSLGLAVVLTATGLLVLYAKNLFPSRRRTDSVFRYLPVLSAAAIVLIGIAMTGYSLGLLPANRLIG